MAVCMILSWLKLVRTFVLYSTTFIGNLTRLQREEEGRIQKPMAERKAVIGNGSSGRISWDNRVKPCHPVKWVQSPCAHHFQYGWFGCNTRCCRMIWIYSSPKVLNEPVSYVPFSYQSTLAGTSWHRMPQHSTFKGHQTKLILEFVTGENGMFWKCN